MSEFTAGLFAGVLICLAIMAFGFIMAADQLEHMNPNNRKPK